MIEQLIEEKIISQMNALGLDALQCSGAWQPSAPGVVKGTEGSSFKAAIVVKVNPRGFDTFTICEVSFDVQIVLVVRIDRDPTGTALVTYAGAVLDLLTKWNLDEGHDWCVDLSCTGFDASGINVGQGTGPDIDLAAGIATCNFGFTLKGSIIH